MPRPGKSEERIIYVAESCSGERIAIMPRGVNQPSDCHRAIRVDDVSTMGAAVEGLTRPSARWLVKRQLSSMESVSPAESARKLISIRAAWPAPFVPTQEKYDGDDLITPGLRPPQIGALHAVLGHWTASHEPVTVVMPTGSGKTDTMVSLFVAAPMTAAKLRGKTLGRPRKLSPCQLAEAQRKLKNREASLLAIAQEYNVGRWTLSRALKRDCAPQGG